MDYKDLCSLGVVLSLITFKQELKEKIVKFGLGVVLSLITFKLILVLWISH